MGALRTGDPARVGAALSNDLQAAALSLRPQLRFTLDLGQEMGALGAVVSGSGPTCAFLATDEEHAVELAVGAVRGRGVPDGAAGRGPGPRRPRGRRGVDPVTASRHR